MDEEQLIATYRQSPNTGSIFFSSHLKQAFICSHGTNRYFKEVMDHEERGEQGDEASEEEEQTTA